MKLIIEADHDRVTSVNVEGAEDGQTSFENVMAIIFCVVENITKSIIESNPDDRDAIWDYVSGACDQLCYRCFPETDTGFELSDAAILYAEDQIIKRAEKKGISYEEALAEYEKKAQKYVAERSGVLNS